MMGAFHASVECKGMPTDPINRSSDNDLTGASTGTDFTVGSVGPYRLLQRLGEGGMGEVWLAEQMRPVHRRVALKVIKPGMDTAQVVARFEAERQALALMDHPAIARVFDAGATSEGRPYFVMEYVRGEPVTAYVVRHKLSLPARLLLFIRVCEGVQHAHQKGIIHRDLKPSNVLVGVQDDQPVPKIIDFGVAKATTRALTDRTLHTEFGMLVGTPEYMSPEQADTTGLDVDTRTDVYALGVLLYELLTGTLPFGSHDLRGKGLDEVRRTIREVDPPRPSTRISSTVFDAAAPRADIARLAKSLRGDLDWITMKALEKDRTRRYATVGELAADVQRHLDDRPVIAGAPSTRYRVHKFVRRNRPAVAAAFIFTILLILFAATMALQARRIAEQRDRATTEANTAKQVSDFLIGLFSVSDPSESRGNTLTAREILDKGAVKVEKDLTTQPAIQARLMVTMGTVYTNLGLYGLAEPLLLRAVATDRRILGDGAPQTIAAVSQLANVYWYQGRLRDAEPLYLEVVDTQRKLRGRDHVETLRAQYELAALYIEQKRLGEAEALQRRVLADQQRVLGAEHPHVLESMNNLASILYAQHNYPEAESLYVMALAGGRRVLGDDHPETLNRLHNLATTYEAMGRYAEAESNYLSAIDRRRRVLGETHPDTARSETRLGRLYQTLRRYSEAESLVLAAWRTDLKTFGPQHPRTSSDIQQLVGLYEAWGKPSEAAEWRTRFAKTGSPSQ